MAAVPSGLSLTPLRKIIINCLSYTSQKLFNAKHNIHAKGKIMSAKAAAQSKACTIVSSNPTWGHFSYISFSYGGF
jgi:hypothetical protein